MSKKKLILSYIAGAIMIVVLIWTYKFNINNRDLLRAEGIKTYGVITKVVNRTRGTDFKYSFRSGLNVYENWEKTYKHISLGDTIEIIYYKKDPSISKPAFELYEK